MITRRAILGCAVAPLFGGESLPEQSAGIVIERGFPDPGISYLLVAAANGRLIGSRWQHPGNPVPMGSLVKPFTALAYGEAHGFRFPEFVCEGERSRCWSPQGHGRMRIVTAIAHSCNAYFLRLAEAVKLEAIERVAQRFGINPPDRESDAAALIGLGESWQVAPLAMARAYLELTARSSEPGIGEVLAGMALSAKSGTGWGIGSGAYAKTGTAPCMHELRHRGDGYAMAMYPIGAPRSALLVRVHGAPGAQAAVVCGRMRKAMRT